jgi:general secretion pathway protein A
VSKIKDMRGRFGFHNLPFTRELRVEERFELPFFEDALEALHQTIEALMSAALIAPAGTGKTALLRALQARLPPARYDVHYVKVTNLSKRDMCREIADCVGARPAASYPMLVRRLQERFTDASDNDGLRPVLLIDEAHDMRPDVLSMLRILTNFDMDSRLVLGVVIAGQTPLRTMLRRDDIQDLARRLAHVAVLRTLAKDESHAYITHRCHIAGSHSVPFSPQAMEALYEIARGNLRATDQLALKTLDVAHRQSDDVASPNHVAQARQLLWP